MTHDEMIAVIQAHKEGKRIEICPRGRNDGWINPMDIRWDFSDYDYRIAREPRKCWVKWNQNISALSPWEAIANQETEGYQLVTEQL